MAISEELRLGIELEEARMAPFVGRRVRAEMPDGQIRVGRCERISACQYAVRVEGRRYMILGEVAMSADDEQIRDDER